MSPAVSERVTGRATAHAELTGLIADLLAVGVSIPCVGRPEWTSHTRHDMKKAARLCEACPVLVECREYARQWEEPRGGVWGGLPPSAEQTEINLEGVTIE